MKYVVRAEDAGLDSPIGGKARALAALAGAEVPIPAWVALTSEALVGVPPSGASAWEDRLNAGLHQVPPEVDVELRQALAEMCPNGELVAVRSSAADEDGTQHSFAGQLESFLSVPPADVPAKVVEVWRSGFSDRVIAYRREHGLSLPPPAPAVLIQRMVNADVSGVAFGADPVSGRRGVVVVSAVRGLGNALVSGEVDADTYHVDRQNQIVHRAAPDSVLSDAQVLAVAELARKAGRHFGRPQDVEWAIERDQFYLLQSRPITSLTGPDPDGVLNIWDNSNIAESYNGVTTPLTFSFARYAYEEVYRQFCRILRVPESVIADNAEVFRHMLGLVRGRVYYNLLNWYRLLAMLPGFTVNRRFMEQMMGVKEGLPDSVAAGLKDAGWRARFRDGLRFLGSVAALARNHLGMNGLIRKFYGRLNDALGDKGPDLSLMRPDELVAYYRSLERQLLTRWDAPLVNDFLAMIFYGVLRGVTTKWCPGGDSLHNDLLCGEGGMISAEPARRVREMTAAATDPDFVRLLREGTLAAILKEMPRQPNFAALYRAYLDKFGDRCLEELKLESSTLHDDPLPLLRSVAPEPAASARVEALADAAGSGACRQEAERRVRAAIGWNPLRRVLFGWVLRNARARVRDRENLRFERTRLFGRVRRIFVELGRRLHALGVLDEPRDVFYLEVNELLGFVDGTATCTDLRGLTALRKAEFDRFRTEAPPADRFETHGVVNHGHDYQGAVASERPSGDRMQGLGCCPGVVRGPVRVVTDPRGARLNRGEILVAERTDPGWIMLFPAAAGLLVERGSLLSHSAIVAREMGIPAVVSIRGVTRWLKDGDWVELDGGKGVVVRLPSPAGVNGDGQ